MCVAACSDLDQGKTWGIASSVHHLKGDSVQMYTQGWLPHREDMMAQGQEGQAEVMGVEAVLLSGVAPGHCTVKPQP